MIGRNGVRLTRATSYRHSGTICGDRSRYGLRLRCGVICGARPPHFLMYSSSDTRTIPISLEFLFFAVCSGRLFLGGVRAMSLIQPDSPHLLASHQMGAYGRKPRRVELRAILPSTPCRGNPPRRKYTRRVARCSTRCRRRYLQRLSLRSASRCSS